MPKMWSRDLPAFTDMSGCKLPITETYLSYDGPVIFLTKIGFENYLVSKVDLWEDGYLLIASSIDSKVIDLLKSNRLSILGAFRSGDFIVIESSYDFTVSRYWSTSIDCFDQDLLPESGKPISFDIDQVADTVDQASSYFSVKLSGDNLRNDSINFHQFKKMIDKAYISIRNLLAPYELKSARSKIYDFKIMEPEFGSLIINIDEPILPSLKDSRKIFDNESVDNAYLNEKFHETRSNAMKNLASLKEAAKDGKIDKSEMSKLSLFIRDFSSILPDRNDLYSDIEFSGNIDGHQEFLRINSSDVSAIKTSMSEFMGQPQYIVGNISIINEGTHNVVIKVLNTNELKCNFSVEDFLTMKRNPDFRTGNKLEVYGVVRKRARRDYMSCQGAGIIHLP